LKNRAKRPLQLRSRNTATADALSRRTPARPDERRFIFLDGKPVLTDPKTGEPVTQPALDMPRIPRPKLLRPRPTL